MLKMTTETDSLQKSRGQRNPAAEGLLIPASTAISIVLMTAAALAGLGTLI